MSGPLRQPQRLLLRSVLQSTQNPRSSLTAPCPQCTQRRHIFNFLFGGKKGKKSSASSKADPFLEDVLSRKSPAKSKAAKPEKGDLSSESVFSSVSSADPSVQLNQEAAMERRRSNDLASKMSALDPDPRARELWQRKKVIQSVRRKERLTKPEFLRKTERELVVRSPEFKTSVKKFGALARQIQGKSVEDALVQMRFSPKKAAKDIVGQLEYVRDMAVVSRGMGLGNVPAKKGEEKAEFESVEIQRKDGRRYTVDDPSKIYIDQAWVGRARYGREADYRARGRTNILRPPHTTISFKLKEETTLVREWKDREEKRRRQRLDKVWMPLPDQPIQGQQQYFTW